MDRMRNVKIREELKQEVGTIEKIRKSQLRQRDALARMAPERLVTRVYEAEREGSRGRW